jgi:hypothetical protein
MRLWVRRRPVGREVGEYIVMRCPRDLVVSAPRSVWAEDRAGAESFGYTLGRRITPSETRRRMRGWLIRSERWARESTLDVRDEAIFRESQAKRSYATIAHEHGISDERVRQIVHRERVLAAQFPSGNPRTASTST